MSETELRDLLGQIIEAEPAPPFTAANYLSAGQAAAVRRRYRRMAIGGFALVGMIIAGAVAAPGLAQQRDRRQAASAVAANPKMSIVPGVYFRTDAPETAKGTAWLVEYEIRWHMSAPKGICSVKGTVFDQNGAKLTSFEDKTSPLPRSMFYRDIVRSSFDAQLPPPYAKVTVTDCQGRTSTDSINIAVDREQETAATFSPGWTEQRCSCWSGGTVRRSGAAGQKATYTAAFNGVAILTTTGPAGGTADVYVDGKYARTINAAAGTATNRVVGFQTHFSGYGTHTVEVRVTKGSIDIDGFLTSHAPSGWGR